MLLTVRLAPLGNILLAGAAAVAQTPPPQTLYVNGNIHTLDARRPRAEVIGVANGRIVFVGARGEIEPPAHVEIVDLHGNTVLPGLIDAHAHVAGLGSFGLGRLDLSDAKSWEAVVEIVAKRASTAKSGEWILGGRWDHESWPDRRLPTHEKLSAISPDNPVWLTRVDGHAGIANAAAMRLAGVARETPDPPGGDIVRSPGGEATGLFIDNAESLIADRIDDPGTHGADASAALILKAQEMCLSVGLTGVHDAGISPAEAATYAGLADAGRLKLRVYAMLSARHAVDYFSKHGLTIGERFTLRSCKCYADGALGSRGAWLLAPYADQPTDDAGNPYAGLAVMPPAFIESIAEKGLERGYQVCTHAIGDRGNRESLDAYALALSRRPRRDHRFRIEHAQLLALEDVPRFRELGVIASMQPTHCTSDMRWVEQRIGGRRVTGAYAWARLLRTGARIAAGSDFPVESHNPFLGLYAAVTRQDLQGEPAGGWRPGDRLTRTEALRAFTLDAAYAAFEESQKGSLEVGKFADFIVIDRDVMACDPRQIPDTRVLQTVIGGETVYEAD